MGHGPLCVLRFPLYSHSCLHRLQETRQLFSQPSQHCGQIINERLHALPIQTTSIGIAEDMTKPPVRIKHRLKLPTDHSGTDPRHIDRHRRQKPSMPFGPVPRLGASMRTTLKGLAPIRPHATGSLLIVLPCHADCEPSVFTSPTRSYREPVPLNRSTQAG
jgi:hypothetical protein